MPTDAAVVRVQAIDDRAVLCKGIAAPRRRSGFCLWLLILCAPLYGIDRDQKLADLHHTAWTFKDGAPAEVSALAQTIDGFLWLGTATGLFRFDGIDFQAYKPESGQAFPQRRVASLFAVPDGGLWVGYWYGGVSFIKDGTVTEYGEREGLPSHAVLAFARDMQGAIWIAAGQDGIARLEGSRWRKIGTDWGVTGHAFTVFVDHAGTVWVGTQTSIFQLVKGARQFQVAAQGLLGVKNFTEADGTLWMAEAGYGVRAVPLPGKNNGKDGPAVLVGSQAIKIDGQGSLWITSAGSGMRRVAYPGRLQPPKIRGPSAWKFQSAEVEAFTQADGLTSDYIYCVLHDREGNVWFGTSGGLDRFRQSPVVSLSLHPISYRGALPIPSLQSFTTSALVAGDDGAIWAGGIGPQVLLKIQNDKIVTQLRDQYVDSAHRDRSGIVWLAMPSGVSRLGDERLNAIDSQQRVTYNYDGALPAGQELTLRRLNLPRAGGIAVIPNSRAKAVTQDRSGRLWMAMGSGAFRLENSGWTSLESLGGPRGVATAVFTDSEGRTWFGLNNTVAMLDGDRVKVFSGNHGIQVGAVTSIHGDGSKIWIGGEFGLEFFDGSRFQPVHPSDGSAFGGVSGIVADAENGLWFSENRGIIHIREAQLRKLDAGKVEFESFGLLDGLDAELRGALASPSAVKTSDGRIWFATTTGVAWIDPRRIVRNTVPPPVAIESVIANGRKYNNLASLKLPARTTDLQIIYTATSLTIPERVSFRYRLEGQDEDWQNAGTRREAFYTNLDPGSYQFRVIACNNDGVWNDTGTSMDFSIAPAYYQTRWFHALMATLILGAAWALYRFRLHQIAHEHNVRIEERVGERTRIARDLHDTLLQSFQGSLFEFQAARNLFRRSPEDAMRALDDGIVSAEAAIAEGRDAIQNLRSDPAVETDLAQLLATAGKELSVAPDANDAIFRLTVEGPPRTLSPVLQDELYRIGREILRNAFRHARAAKVEVEIRYDDRLLRLRIRDDGIGIDPKVLVEGASAGHWGLPGIRERAKLVGAKLDFWSEAGAGTEVQLIVPASVAYQKSPDAGVFGFFRKATRSHAK